MMAMPADPVDRADGACLSVDEVDAGIIPADAEDLMPHGGLDQDRQIPAGCDRHGDLRNGDPEDVADREATAQSIDTLQLPLVEGLKIDDQIQCLASHHRALAKHGADVEDPETSDLEEIAQRLGAGPFQGLRGDACETRRIIGDQTVAARDQVERELALADGRVANQKHAHPQNLDEDAVHGSTFGQGVCEEVSQMVDQLLIAQR
jgi:hypothetical protein